jgi:hypothetical protein
VSVPEQEKIEHCVSCGKPVAGRLITEIDDETPGRLIRGIDAVSLCEECIARLQSRGGVGVWVHTEEEPPPPEARFDELFKAARVLFKEGITKEDQIFPTLAFANEIGQGTEHLVAEKERLARAKVDGETWEREANLFLSKYGRLRPVRIVDGILILERLPVSIVIHNHQATEIPEEVAISIYPHPQPAQPEHVASLYSKTLSAAAVPCEEDQRATMGFDFRSWYLIVTAQRADVRERLKRTGVAQPIDAASFPHPRLVQEFYRMLLGVPSSDGFARYLVTRERGGAPEADNLIPACVAFYLRNYGKIEGRKVIHRLLNEYVLCETWKTLPEDAFSSSETNQFWRDVNDKRKVGNPLMIAAHGLFFQAE